MTESQKVKGDIIYYYLRRDISNAVEMPGVNNMNLPQFAPGWLSLLFEY
jgi:hypothetical protein